MVEHAQKHFHVHKHATVRRSTMLDVAGGDWDGVHVIDKTPTHVQRLATELSVARAS